ncbi:MAG: asparagine synthase (glutamine-hydrolyzing) [Halanaerobiaceae bacterium]
MCGIAGWISNEKDLRENKKVLRNMNQKLGHRGPDEGDEWFSREAGLVHSRLIVIDPGGGKQPMVRHHGGEKYIMVYNGELYNTGELRSKLQRKGYDLYTQSDTEVLLISYIEWGEECVKKLNGIFAFAIREERANKLFMARDRIGVKPLFYYPQSSGIIFASELKSLLAHPEIAPQVTITGLAEVLAMGPGRTPGCGIFRGVKELKPGHFLVQHREEIWIKQYWCLQSGEHPDSTEKTLTKLKELFIDTVDRQLVSDVPICTFLSGGLDSSAITVVAQEMLSEQLHTYSVDYEDNAEYFAANEFQPDSDNKWIRLVSENANTIHHNVEVSNENLITGLYEAVLARDLPGMADIDTSLYLFCRKVKEKFTVAVSGECADEIFGGYPWFYRDEDLNSDIFPWARELDFKFDLLDPEISSQIKPAEYVNMRYKEALSEVPLLPGENEKNRRMREIFYLNLTRWMPVLLDRKDRMSMYTGLEVRVPFCDHRLVQYVWNIPWKMKNYGGQRKGILRGALKGILPEEIRTRPKNPYPRTFNPAYYRGVRNWLREILNDSQNPLHIVINTNKVIKLIEKDKMELDVPWFGQLMRLPQLFAYLIQLNIWMEEYDVELV